ncbi:MAG: helix-turn-helix transcriptional regulator [Eggerthellaceae bacterium]|nr:helix-turn-helix transcriptional regulator [Eggerthellaceae bacterium]
MSHERFVVERIKRECKRYGMSTAELGRRTGIPEDQLRSAFRGRRNLKAGEAARLCLVLGIPLEELLPPEMLRILIKVRVRS